MGLLQTLGLRPKDTDVTAQLNPAVMNTGYSGFGMYSTANDSYYGSAIDRNMAPRWQVYLGAEI